MKASNAQFKASLKKHAGVLSFVADDLGLSRQAVHQRINKSPELLAFKSDIEERLLDLAEAGVAKKLIAGDGTTQRWLLELKGKNRGYARRQELTGENGEPIKSDVSITVNYIGAPAPETGEEEK